jgi:hypothetical protein
MGAIFAFSAMGVFCIVILIISKTEKGQKWLDGE